MKRIFFLIAFALASIVSQSEAQTQQQLTNFKTTLTNEKSQLLLTAEGQPHVVVPKFYVSPGTLSLLETNSTRFIKQVKPVQYQKMASAAATTLLKSAKNLKGRAAIVGLFVAGTVYLYQSATE
jgi:hypothetical protein